MGSIFVWVLLRIFTQFAIWANIAAEQGHKDEAVVAIVLGLIAVAIPVGLIWLLLDTLSHASMTGY